MQLNQSYRVGIGVTTGQTVPSMARANMILQHEDTLKEAMQALERLTEPPSYEELYEEIKRVVGYDEGQIKAVVDVLMDQYRLLEERERQIKEQMNQPVDWLQESLPMLMLSAMMGDPEVGVMSTLMMMMRQPELERARQDRYWRAITDLLSEKNKVIAAIRSWETAGIQQRQHIASQTRMIWGRLSDNQLKRMQMVLKDLHTQIRLQLDKETEATRRIARARSEYYRVYDQLLRTLERYHDIEARSQIYQSFAGLMEDLAREGELRYAPHRMLYGVLQTPSLRATQAMLNIANAAQRLELNEILYHRAQLGLVNQQLAIAKAQALLEDYRAGRLRNLSPGALLTIASAIDFYKAQAQVYPELRQRLAQAFGPDWEEAMDRIYSDIAVQVIEAATANQPLSAAQRQQLVQAAMTDPSLLQRYLAQIAGVQRVADIPIDHKALGYLPVAIAPEGGVNTYRFSAVVEQLVQDALRSAAWHTSLRPELEATFGVGTDTYTDTGAATSTDDLSTIGPGGGQQGPTGSIATVDLEQVLYREGTSTNILNLNALLSAYTGNQQIVVRNGTPEANRTLSAIQSRHLVYLQQPDGRRIVVPVVGISTPMDPTDPQKVRAFNGLQAHGFLRDAQNRTRVAVTVPVPITRVNDQAYDLTRRLREILSDPNRQFDVDLVLINNEPIMVVSALYPFVQNGRRAGYRVPVLMMSPVSFGQMMSARIGQWQNVPRLPNEQPIPIAQVGWRDLIPATFNVNNDNSLWRVFLKNLDEALKEPDATQRAAKVRALWLQTRNDLNNLFKEHLNGADFFRSIRWIPIPAE